MKTRPSMTARILCPILILASLCMIFLPWVSVSAYGYGVGNISFFQLLQVEFRLIPYMGYVDSGAQVGLILVAVFSILMILAGILGIVLSALGKKVGPIPYFALTMIALIGMIIITASGNETFQRLMYQSYGVYAEMGLGIGSIICAALALIAMILMLVLKEPAPQRVIPAPMPAPTPEFVPAPMPMPEPIPAPAPMPAPAPVQEDLGYTVPVNTGKLVCVSGTYAGYDFDLNDGEQFIIGKDANVAQIVIDPSYKQVSRKHVGIMYDSARDQYRVTDYSTNGTLADGKKLEPGKATYLRRGTIISLADEKNAFRLN